MTFKEKYKDIIAEYEKFWERKNNKRPILHFTYTKDATLPPFPAPINPAQRFLDEKYILAEYDYTMLQRNGYIAEGYPYIFTNFGPGCLAACIGGDYQLAESTIWYDHKKFIKDWEDAPKISFNENSELWQHVLRLQHAFGQRGIHFTMTDIGGILDIVASLRQTEDLLYDLYDYPEEVQKFSAQVVKEWDKAFRQQIEIIKKYNQPFNGWMGILSEKPWYPLQCDFCYMLSPEQFDQFVYKDLQAQVNSMERSIYHLDGVGELTHVDKILDIDKLNGIQWTSGAGNEGLCSEKWFDLYRKIQDKKKNVVLLGGIDENDMAGAERLIKSLDPTGLYISAHFSSQQKAEDAVEKITKWCE